MKTILLPASKRVRPPRVAVETGKAVDGMVAAHAVTTIHYLLRK